MRVTSFFNDGQSVHVVKRAILQLVLLYLKLSKIIFVFLECVD